MGAPCVTGGSHVTRSEDGPGGAARRRRPGSAGGAGRVVKHAGEPLTDVKQLEYIPEAWWLLSLILQAAI